MKKVCSLFLVLLLTLFLSGCGDDDDTDTTSGTGTDTTTSNYKNKETYTSQGVAPANRGGGTTFRINKKGTAYGKTIKVVFSNGWSVVISDTSKRYTKDGFIYRPGIGSKQSGTGTSHGGVFICANSGNRSRSLTVYY
jgi:hypothetical protein